MIMKAFILQSEKIRWSRAIVEYEKQQKTLCGDVLITSAFVSYMGYFTRPYRAQLLNNEWIPFLRSQKVRPVLQLICLGWTAVCLKRQICSPYKHPHQSLWTGAHHTASGGVQLLWHHSPVSVPGLCTPDRRPGSNPHAYRWRQCGRLA